MSKQVYTVTKEGLEYLCGLINKIVSLPSDVIDNLNLADNTTFSSTKIDVLINQALLDANTHAEELCNALTKLTCEKTTVQPTLDNSELNIIYLFSDDGNAPFQQFLKISDTELIDLGSTSISLNNYLTVTDAVNTYAKKIDLDTLVTEVTNIKSDLNNKANSSDIPTKTSQLTNDSGFINKDVTTTISSTSTDDEIPTAKAVYDMQKVINLGTYTNGENFIDVLNEKLNPSTEYGRGLGKVILMGFSNTATGMPNNTSGWWNVVVFSVFTEKIVLAQNTWRQPSEYTTKIYYDEDNDTWVSTGWRKILTESV